MNFKRVEFSNFKEITKKEVAYFLGFFWADGYISRNEICLTIKQDDSLNLLTILNKFGNWRINNRIKKLKNKGFNSSCIRINDKQIKEFLVDNDYLNKSLTTPTKILSLISDDLKNLWSCDYSNLACFCSKNRNYFSITGNINQNWLEIEKLFKSLYICYKITKKERKTGNSSFIVISNKKDIIKLGNYIYTENFDQIGLKRKYQIYEEIKNKPNRATVGSDYKYIIFAKKDVVLPFNEDSKVI